MAWYVKFVPDAKGEKPVNRKIYSPSSLPDLVYRCKVTHRQIFIDKVRLHWFKTCGKSSVLNFFLLKTPVVSHVNENKQTKKH